MSWGKWRPSGGGDPLQANDPWPRSMQYNTHVVVDDEGPPPPLNDVEMKSLAVGRGLLAALVRANASRHEVATATVAVFKSITSTAPSSSGIASAAEAASSFVVGNSSSGDVDIETEVAFRLSAL